VPSEHLSPNPPNPAGAFFRYRARRAGASDQGARHHPAGGGARRARLANAYEIIAGERRWRRRKCRLHDVPIVPIEATDEGGARACHIENVQRSDLNPLEERAATRRWRTSTSTVTRTSPRSSARAAATSPTRCAAEAARLVKAYIDAGKITAGAARMLIGAPIRRDGARDRGPRLNVRQVEALAKERSKAPDKSVKKRAMRTPTRSVGARVSNALGLTVTVDHLSKGGVLKITTGVSISSTMCCGGWRADDGIAARRVSCPCL